MTAPRKIFLVDDDIFCLNLYAHHINNIGYGFVETFSNGADCLAHLCIDPAIIFLDVEMGDLCGEDVLLRIKAQQPEAYVVMISAQDDLKQALHLLQLGAYDYVLKGDDDMEKIRLILNRIHAEEELKQAQRELSRQREIIAYQHNRIQESIKAALRIQQIILPSSDQCKEILPDHFIIYQPKDIVSGDFYMVEKHAGKIFIVCADCTGHGVSGAFVTLIAHQILHNLLFEKMLENPAHILEEADTIIRKVMTQKQTRLDMGMDIGLLMIEENSPETFEIRFAGAKNHLYILPPTETTAQILQGTKRPVGSSFYKQFLFTEERLNLPKGTLLYMSSDGFRDQNNAEGKKLGKKRLLELIEQNGVYSLPAQRDIFLRAFEEHKGEQVQRDDVLLMGFRL